MNGILRRVGVTCLLSGVVLAGGCKRFQKLRKTRSAPKSDSYADKLKPIVAAKKVNGMKFADFADYAPLVQTFYEDRNFEVAWVDGAKPSDQARAFITAFQHAQEKGLNPEDFNASQWEALTAKLKGGADDDIAQFDATMTVSVMRYISDLRLGRVNPTHFNFDINTADKKYDLPEFLSDNAVDATDVPKLIASVEPDSESYRQTEAALGKYLELAKQPMPEPLPVVVKPLTPGAPYPAAAALRTRLQLEGDLGGDAAGGSSKVQPGADSDSGSGSGSNSGSTSGSYTAELAEGVKHYQQRHGLTDDGKLSPQTIASLNVPLSARVQQLSDSLERWRWLPDEYLNAQLTVNLPEFLLRGYEGTGTSRKEDFSMKVVDGQVVGEHQTPVFTQHMKYVIFRPYWNVPISIIKKELMAHIAKSGVGYLAKKNFETVDSKGEKRTATASEIEHGNVVVREKPGPKNSLGLIKFMFPNEYDIYLHSTPAPELFNRTRRDFSHGCVRVQKPDELAVWVLRNTPGDWTLDKVHEAFNDEAANNKTVTLKQQIPIVIFYATANVNEDGTTHFFDDLYGYDKQLDDVLAKGMPYPSQQGKVDPKAVATPGDTD